MPILKRILALSVLTVIHLLIVLFTLLCLVPVLILLIVGLPLLLALLVTACLFLVLVGILLAVGLLAGHAIMWLLGNSDDLLSLASVCCRLVAWLTGLAALLTALSLAFDPALDMRAASRLASASCLAGLCGAMIALGARFGSARQDIGRANADSRSREQVLPITSPPNNAVQPPEVALPGFGLSDDRN